MLQMLGIHILGRALTSWSSQIQRYAARYVTSNFSRTASVTNILQDLKWPSLQQRHQQSHPWCTRSPISWSTLTVPVTSPWLKVIHTARILQPSCNSVVYADSFFPQRIHDWKQLPTNPLHYRTVDSFQELPKFWFAIKILIFSSRYVGYLFAVRSSSHFHFRSHTIHGRRRRRRVSVRLGLALRSASTSAFYRFDVCSCTSYYTRVFVM